MTPRHFRRAMLSLVLLQVLSALVLASGESSIVLRDERRRDFDRVDERNSTKNGNDNDNDNDDDPDYGDVEARYRMPALQFALNGGKPFSLEKDPITGKIDFEKTPPRTISVPDYVEGGQSTGEERDEEFDHGEDVEENRDAVPEKGKVPVDFAAPNEINPYSPSFHDFLNLPVRYSSSKYPLISSSYANTKVQSGSNSYSTYNHKPYQSETTERRPALYFTTHRSYLPKTTSTAVPGRITTEAPPRVITTPATAAPSTTTVTTTTSRTTITTTTTIPTTTTTTKPELTTAKPKPTAGPTMTAASSSPPQLPVTTWKPSTFGTTTPTKIPPHSDYGGSYSHIFGDDYEDTYEYDGPEDYSRLKEGAQATTPSTTTTTVPPSTTSPSSTTTQRPIAMKENRPLTSLPLHREQIDLHENRAPLPSPPSSSPPPSPPLLSFASPALQSNEKKVADNIVDTVLFPPNNGLPDRVASASNVFVPPGRDTVSFVLGNRQNVEGVGHYVGTAVQEKPYATDAEASLRPVVREQDTRRPGEGYVAFPGANEDRPTIEEHVVVVNEADGSIHELPPVLVGDTRPAPPPPSSPLPSLIPPRREQSSIPRLPELSASLTPPLPVRPMPIPMPPPHHRRQRPPTPLRYPKPNDGRYPADKRISQRPDEAQRLPNILPQFRPNAKESHGVRLPVRRPPSYLQRIGPPPPPSIRAVGPPPPPSAPGFSSSAGNVVIEGIPPNSVRPTPLDRRSDSFGPPPARVATLQMIQQRGSNLDERVVKPNLPPPFRVNFDEDAADNEPSETADSPKGAVDEGDDKIEEEDKKERPVFVVYPAAESTETKSAVVVGTHGPQRPLPPSDLKDEVIGTNLRIGASGGRPYVRTDFPYPLERPDPSLLMPPRREKPLLVPSGERSEESDEKREEEEEETEEGISGVNVIPYLQDYTPFRTAPPDHRNSAPTLVPSSAMPPTSTPTPIAYAYTPTSESSVDRADYEGKPVLPSRRPSNPSNSAPSAQSFMAPFFASVSAEAPSKSGWSVVAKPTIERNASKGGTENGTEATAEDAAPGKEGEDSDAEFDAENFKPQLFGGFKPIYEFPAMDEVSTTLPEQAREGRLIY